jgi:glycosyltransferase involved in cell wall biosynthesis
MPFPPLSGGRADNWRRLVVLKELGCEIALVTYYSADGNRGPDESAIATVRSIVSDLVMLPVSKAPNALVRRAVLLVQGLPSHVASRTPTPKALDLVLERLRRFRPTAVWLDGPWGGEVGRAVKRECSVPLFYRSNNVEHLYLRRQAGAARARRDKFAWWLASLGLEAYQLGLMNEASMVFDISMDDLRVWEGKGVSRIKWLPPLPEAALRTPANLTTPREKYDLLFLGNLTTPNNVRGVTWLVEDILPLVIRRRPDLRVCIAGSNPGEHVRAVCQKERSVTLKPNVTDPLVAYRSARVLLNPVRTGSGVQVKMLDMLMTDAAIVTTSQGIAGLPPQVRSCVRVADDAHAFAAAILEALEEPAPELAARCELRKAFSKHAIADVLTDLDAGAPSNEQERGTAEIQSV